MPDNFPELMWRQILPPQMIKDLSRLAAVPADQIKLLSEAISEYDILGSESDLAELVSKHLPDTDEASSILNVLRSLRPGNVPQILEVVARWRQDSAEHAHQITEEAFAAIEENLRLLIRDYPAVAKIRKANWLGKATGNELQDVHIICDLRPVFNESRDAIDLLVPISTLKISYLRQNGQDDVFEIVLDEDELAEMSKKLEIARQKLSSLEQFIQNRNE